MFRLELRNYGDGALIPSSPDVGGDIDAIDADFGSVQASSFRVPGSRPAMTHRAFRRNLPAGAYAQFDSEAGPAYSFPHRERNRHNLQAARNSVHR